MVKYILALYLLISCCGIRSSAQTTVLLDSTLLDVRVVVDSGATFGPWDIEWGWDNKLWMTDRKYIRRYDTLTHSLKIMGAVPKGNLMGLAVPTAASTGFPYVYAVADTAVYYLYGHLAQVHRFRYDAAQDTLINDTVLFSYPHAGEHVGGKIISGPDGNIWFTTADYSYGLDTPGSALGKVLRMQPDGSRPADNPRADLTWSYGHRNPEGMVLLPDGKVYVSEHGFLGNDELNYIRKESNYGWPAYDGGTCSNIVPDTCSSATFTFELPKAIIGFPPGGVAYYGYPQIPEWQGCLLVGALGGNGNYVSRFQLNASHDNITAKRHYLLPFGRIRDICPAPDGSLFMIVYDRQGFDTASHVYNSRATIIRLRNTGYRSLKVPAVAEARLFTLYPNPGRDEINVTLLQGAANAEYWILDGLGRNLRSGSFSSGTYKIDISGLASGPGLLLLTVKGHTQGISFQILK